MSLEPLTLHYGHAGHFACQMDPARLLGVVQPQAPMSHLVTTLRHALAEPLDFPPLAQMIVPGDRVVLALDRQTPCAATIVAELWRVLEQRGVNAEDLNILHPASFEKGLLFDPRLELPAEIRDRVNWNIHDPTDTAQLAYLAATAQAEPIYLARALVEADVVIPVGPVAFDSLLGYRGTSSVLYPGLSNTEALQRAHGLGHSELGLQDERPLRQRMDEIGWLLGCQFAVQVVASSGMGVTDVMAGATESVFRHGQRRLAARWLLRLPQRAHIVIAAIENDIAGHGWSQFGAALATAKNLVAKGGVVVMLTELSAELGPGLELIRECQSARTAVKKLREQAPPDLLAATQVAAAADWAHVYVMSKLETHIVEDLFMTPLAHDRELQRLIQTSQTCVVLNSAQHVHGEIG